MLVSLSLPSTTSSLAPKYLHTPLLQLEKELNVELPVVQLGGVCEGDEDKDDDNCGTEDEDDERDF